MPVGAGKDFIEFVKSLPPSALEQLYAQSTTCIAVYRELSILARHIVNRILFVEHPVPKSVVFSWVTAEHQSEQQEACDQLTHLRIWSEQQQPGGLIAFTLSPNFRLHFQSALRADEGLQTSTDDLGEDKHAKDIAFLDKYSTERWECILHFMVGSKESSQSISRDIADILLESGLMKGDAADSSPGITELGFHFLLMDTASQVWYFLQQYLATAETRFLDLVECISLLLQLNFSALGKDLPTMPLTRTQNKFLQHLRELGLIYQRKRTSNRFYPTRLAVNVVSAQNKSATDNKGKGFIVVETNYRVYAYTSSPLQVALLTLFCDMLYRFPNLVVGNITREAVRTALQNGIKSEQIINYLTMHAHPQMMSSRPILPPTIIDQIRLWEIERNRFTFTEGVLYNQFLSQGEFELLRDYSRDIGVLLCENNKSRTIVVTKQGHDDVKKFWKRQKKS